MHSGFNKRRVRGCKTKSRAAGVIDLRRFSGTYRSYDLHESN